MAENFDVIVIGAGHAGCEGMACRPPVRGGAEPCPPFIPVLLVDGVVKGVGSVLVFLPQILILFAFIAVLEDCGYMARAAYLMDRVMARAGLNGKSFIPLLSSVAIARTVYRSAHVDSAISREPLDMSRFS